MGAMTCKTTSVFSAKNCINPTAATGHSFGFSTVDFKTRADYGTFDLAKGIFTVKMPGLYQLNFSSHALVNVNSGAYIQNYEMRVDGTVKALYHTYMYPQHGVYNPVLISALLPLKSGEKVGVFSVSGSLHEDATKYITCFSCVFVSDKP